MIGLKSYTFATPKAHLRTLASAVMCALCMVCTGIIAHAAVDSPIVTRVLAVGDERAGRVIIDFDRPVELTHSLLESPWRLVLDSGRLVFGLTDQSKSFTGLVQDIRYGDMDKTHSRMILEFGQPFEITNLTSQNGADGLPFSVIIEYHATDPDTFARSRLDLMKTASVVVQTGKSDRLGVVASGGSPQEFVVVLDPGHGGIDSGAVGVSGVREKDIVLDFAQTLRAELEKYANIRVQLTRDSDMFVRLDDRVRTARQNNAQLFVSLHADSVRQNYVRGATVYTISDKASDAVAAELAASENASDAIAGIEYDGEVAEVENILVDLARRETLGLSVQFARLTIGHIEEVARTIKNPHRFAGFRVLKAPDVPSVLVELGYLSNADDEKLLRDPQWRQKMAVELAEAIGEFGMMSGREVALRDAE
ncbi:MAG: N-acetylmuramoyl-L-alanine amidase [Pseudomonadota bacterium]